MKVRLVWRYPDGREVSSRGNAEPVTVRAKVVFRLPCATDSLTGVAPDPRAM